MKSKEIFASTLRKIADNVEQGTFSVKEISISRGDVISISAAEIVEEQIITITTLGRRRTELADVICEATL